MTEIHLVSSSSNTYENNTRSSFENDIPHYKDLSYIGICLKDLYFQANFCNVNKQDHPHIIFIVKNQPFSDNLSVDDDDEEFSENDSPNYLLQSDLQSFGNGQRSVIDKYDFGKTIKTTIGGNFEVLEVIFHPGRYEEASDIVNIFNHIFARNFLKKSIFFYEIQSENKIGYKTRDTLILFDLKFLEFLGLKKNDRRIFSSSQVESLGNLVIRNFLIREFGNNHYYFFDDSEDFFNPEGSESKIFNHIGEYKLNLKINTPEKVIVQCESVDSQVYKSKLIRYLGIINLVSNSNKLKNYQTYNEKNHLIHYQPVHPLFLPVKSDSLQSIKISLKEESGNPLSLETAGPTLITLKTTKNYKMNCHNLVFSKSNDDSSLQLYPGNKAGKFYHRLPKDIELKKFNLGVEIVSLSLSKKIYNITRPFSIINLTYEVENHEKSQNSKMIMDLISEEPGINIIYDEYSILPSINLKSGYYQDLKSIIEKNQDEFLSVGIRLEQNKNRLTLINQVNQKLNLNLTITLSIHNNLALMFGMTNQISNQKFHLTFKDKFVCPYHTNTQLLYPDYILVYSDFIENSIVGGVEAPILKVISSPSVDEKSSEREYYDFQGQNIIETCKDTLTEFCIELRDISGRILEYDSSAYTEILLAFKEKL